MTKRKRISLKIIGGVLIGFSVFRWWVYFGSSAGLYSYYGLKGFLYAWPDALVALALGTIGGILWNKAKGG
jgi:hypothetical protein